MTLRFLNLTNVHFGNPKGPRLRGINLHLEAPLTCALIGDSLSCKSQLAAVMAGALCPFKGRILRDFDQNPSDKAKAHRSIYIPRGMTLGNGDRPFEELWQSAKNSGLEPQDRMPAIRSVAQKLGLLGCLETRSYQLPESMRRLCAIAAKFVDRPDAAILDEPYGGLNDESASRLRLYLDEFSRSKLLIVTSRNMLPVANFDYFVFLDRGKIKVQGRNSHLMKRYGIGTSSELWEAIYMES